MHYFIILREIKESKTKKSEYVAEQKRWEMNKSEHEFFTVFLLGTFHENDMHAWHEVHVCMYFGTNLTSIYSN